MINNRLINGFLGLTDSRKGVLCLLVLNCLTILTAIGKVDGIAFCGGCTLISSIFMYTHQRQQIAMYGNKGP
jgi:hypothetical protein